MSAPLSITDVHSLRERADLRTQRATARRWQQLQQRHQRGQPYDRLLADLQTTLQAAAELVAQRTESHLAISYPEQLPVSGHREAVLAALQQHQVLVLTGETGSGKTTQLPKMLLEAGYGRRGQIACTQPRRIAAHSVAARISEELAAPSGVVASAVRFDDRSTEHTRIKVMTDGLLLAEAARDLDLLGYDAVIIDEAHERSLNIDVLMGTLRRLVQRRPDLRVVVTSATIDADRFAAYFGSAEQPIPVIAVSGRTFPVEIRYQPQVDQDLGYLDAAVEAIRELHQEQPAGDVLCFLPTERDILDGQRRLNDLPGMTVLPLFGRLNASEQQRVFASSRGRKVVLATNIAETSLTVPGIHYVVDAGLARVKRYAAASRTERLPIEAVSQASLAQRAGRAGRIAAGVCIRLFAEPDVDGRSAFTDPEIKRSNLAGVLLRHLSMGLGDPEDFPWLDPPPPAAWHQARRLVAELGALNTARRGRHALTAIGRRLAAMPVDPQIGRIMLAAVELGCAHEVTALAAFLSIQDPRLRPPEQAGLADQAHAQFAHEAGDLLGVLSLWDAYHQQASHGNRKRWCTQTFVSHRRMREWADLRHQLWRQLRDDRELGSGLPQEPFAADQRPIDAIHQAVLHGMLGNVALNDQRKRCYRGTGNRELQIHPGSALRVMRDGSKRPRLPDWVVACEVIETSRTFARLCAPIDPLWIERIAGDRVKRSYREPSWHRPGQRVICRERVTWHGLPIIAARRVAYAPVDPVDATKIFIRAALVQGGLQQPPKVVATNRELMDRAQQVAARIRNPDAAVDDDTLVAAYEHLLLPGAREQPVSSADQLTAWLRQHGPQRLRLNPADLIDVELWDQVEQGFPNYLQVGQRSFELHYRYAPGDEDDGVTLAVTEADLVVLRQVALNRIIPGLLPAQVEALVRALPKDLRRSLIPLQQTVVELLPRVRELPIPLHHAVGRAVGERLGRPVASPDPAVLPPELRLRVVVRDADGLVRYRGRDIEEALAGVGGSDPLAPVRSLWATEPGHAWPGELPKQVDAYGIQAWIGLQRDRGIDAGVAARRAVYATREAMLTWHQDGLEALLEGNCEDLLDAAVASIADQDDRVQSALGIRGGAAMRQLLMCALSAIARTGGHNGPMGSDVGRGEMVEVRDHEQWAACLASAREQLPVLTRNVAQILSELSSSVAAIRKRLRRGLRGLAAAAMAQAAVADVDRLFAPGWTGRLPWSHVLKLPNYVNAIAQRLDTSERNPDQSRRDLDRRQAWLQRWSEAVGEVSPRVWMLLGQVHEWRDLAGLIEDCIAGSDRDAKQAGVRVQNGLRQLSQALDDFEAVQRTMRGDLLELRPVLERVGQDRQGRGLLGRLDATVRDFPDRSVGADLGGQRQAAQDLVKQIRWYIRGD